MWKVNRITALMLSVCMLGAIAPLVFAETYEEKIWANEVFSDAAMAEKLQHSVIMSIGVSYGFINNIKSKINETKNMAPYRMAEEIYIPIAYTAKGMNLKVTETENGLTVSDGDVQKVFDDGNSEIKSETYFTPVKNLCDSFDLEYAVIEDVVIITAKGNSFDTTNKSVTDQIKTALSYEWNSFQIHAYGYTTGIFAHPKNPEVIWVRTDVGGAYKLDLKSGKWICMTDCISGYNEKGESMWMHQPVESLAMDPNDENTVYIAVGNSQYTTDILGAIYKTTDGGNSWRMLSLRKVMYGSHPARMSGEMLAVDPNNSNVIYCGTYYDGLWKSEDGGETWSNVSEIGIGIRGTHDFAVNNVVFDDRTTIDGKSANIYVGVVSTGIYHSNDGGKSFKLMQDSPTASSRMSMFRGDLYVASGTLTTWAGANGQNSNGLFRCHNGKWENLTKDANFANPALHAFYIDEKNPNNIVLTTRAFTFPRKMYRTTNGGKTWDDYTLGDAYNSNACCLIKDPRYDNGMLLAWGFGVTSVPDITAEKLEFELYDAGIEELMFRDIKCMPEGATLNWVAGCCDKGCVISKGLEHWEVAKPPTWNFCQGLDFCESDPNIIVRAHVGHNVPPGKIILTEDSGENWKEAAVYEGTMAGNVAVGASKQKNGYPIVLTTTITAGKAAMYRTWDMGATWETLDVPFTLDGKTGRRYLLSDRVNGNVFYFWSDDGFLYRTMDGGTKWNKISSIVVADYTQYMEAPFGIEGHLWACLGKNGLVYSTDYGVRWNTVEGFSNVKTVTFGKAASGSTVPTVFAMGTYRGEEGMFRSDDYGKTWVSIAGSFSYGGATESAYIAGDRNYYGRLWLSSNGRGVFYGQPKSIEDEKPEITVENTLTETVIEDTLQVKGRINVSAEVRVNNMPVEVSSDGHFQTAVKLQPGQNRIPVEAVDNNLNVAEPVWLDITYDPSFIDIQFNHTDYKSNQSEFIISGKTNRPLTLTINGNSVSVDETNHFSYPTEMKIGDNAYTIMANTGEYSKAFEIHGLYETEPPVIEYAADTVVIGDGVVVSGKINKPGEVRINGKNVPVYSDNTFKSFLQIKAGEYPVIIQARDIVGNVAKPVITSVESQKLTDFTIHDGTISHTEENFQLTGDVYADFGELPYTCNLMYSGETTNVTTFALRWDEEALYIGAEVIDDVLMSTGTNYYDRDCLEIYLDGTNAKVDNISKTDTYKQFMIPFEGAMTEGAERITTITEKGFMMEIKIPWKNVGKGVTVSPGHKIGLDVDNCDTAGTTREAQVGWCGDPDSYRRTDRYATMTLVK